MENDRRPQFHEANEMKMKMKMKMAVSSLTLDL